MNGNKIIGVESSPKQIPLNFKTLQWFKSFIINPSFRNDTISDSCKIKAKSNKINLIKRFSIGKYSLISNVKYKEFREL